MLWGQGRICYGGVVFTEREAYDGLTSQIRRCDGFHTADGVAQQMLQLDT